MSKRIMALAAVLLAGGIGTAAAQGQTQGQMQGQATPGQASQGQMQRSVPGQAVPVPGSTPPLYHQQAQAPASAPLGPNIDKPKANPSAAGTLTQWRQPGHPLQGKANKGRSEHTGSVGTNANTHPLKALEARGQPHQEGMTESSGVHPTPQPTMEAGPHK